MTPAQDKLYWRTWGKAVAANGWRMDKCRLQGLPEDVPVSHTDRDLRPAAIRFALQCAAREFHGPTPNDLRHGAHCLALGRDKSHRTLTNPELTRVLALFRLLADPADLKARVAWDHPEEARRSSLVEFVRRCGTEAARRSVSQNAFQTSEWEELEESQLKYLLRQLKERFQPRRIAVDTPF